MRRGLTGRTIAASALLALVVAAAFTVLVRAIGAERDSAARATRSQQVLVDADAVERLVVDLETGQRGYIITREERFLEPWTAARAAYSRAIARLRASTRGARTQERRATQIGADVDAYVREYSVPLVAAARRDDPSADSASTLDEGKRRADAIRSQFDRLTRAERALFETRDARADDEARRAVTAAAVGLAGSIALIVLFGVYVTRAVALPVRRAAAMAGRLAGGDLGTRMPEGGAGEIDALGRAFNTMGASLESSRDELRRLADEQAALRRVATLVARGVPPAELIQAATVEVRDVLGADAAALLHYEPDGTVTVVSGDWTAGEGGSMGRRMRLEGDTVVGTVLRTGRPARKESYEDAVGTTAEEVRRLSIRSSVGAPVVVEGRPWGVMVASWREMKELSLELETRMAEFTELIATAIANAQSRAELAASRARVVATADETRRRIERDLHDGAQQRLVHAVINLKLGRRALGDAPEPALELVDAALEQAQLATAELRELAHGILPAALDRGLSAGIEALVSRMQLPVTLDVTSERLAPAIEATAYFIVAEALTNAVKHASATRLGVTAKVESGALRVEIRDDGVGGASVSHGSGLVGLHDRAAAANGRLSVESPPGGGTVVTAILPLLAPEPDGSAVRLAGGRDSRSSDSG